MSYSEGAEAESETSADFKVTQALRRLEVQLSLNEDNIEEIAPVYNENEAARDSKPQNYQGMMCKQEESAALSGPDNQELFYDGYNGKQGNIKKLELLRMHACI